MASTPGYGDVVIERVLRVMDDRAVFLVRRGRESLVMKRFLGPEAPRVVHSLAAELDRMAEAMGKDPFRLVACRAAEPEAGFVLMSRAPGKRLSEAIARADGARRHRLIGLAGQWLAAYAEPRRLQGTFGPAHWIRRASTRTKDHLPAEEAAAVRAGLEALGRRANAHAGRPVTRAATHGDFVPVNLHLDRGALWGLDIQGECWFPLARDAARFLIWVHCFAPDGAPTGPLGLSGADVDAMLASGLLPEAEASTILPFFVGEQILVRTGDASWPASGRRRLLQALASFAQAPIAP